MDIRKILGKVVEVNDLEDLFKYVNKLIIPEIVIFENEEYQANFIDTSYYIEVLLKRKKDITLHILPPVKYEKSEEKTKPEMEIELKDLVYEKMNKYF